MGEGGPLLLVIIGSEESDKTKYIQNKYFSTNITTGILPPKPMRFHILRFHIVYVIILNPLLRVKLDQKREMTHHRDSTSKARRLSIVHKELGLKILLI